MTNLTENNILLYAAQQYNNTRLLDPDEFYEDFSRFRYLKRLITRYYKKNILQERLILNHLIQIYNVFDIDGATHICKFKIKKEHWPALKTFLLYLNYIDYKEDTHFINISTDLYITKKLQNI